MISRLYGTRPLPLNFKLSLTVSVQPLCNFIISIRILLADLTSLKKFRAKKDYN